MIDNPNILGDPKLVFEYFEQVTRHQPLYSTHAHKAWVTMLLACIDAIENNIVQEVREMDEDGFPKYFLHDFFDGGLINEKMTALYTQTLSLMDTAFLYNMLAPNNEVVRRYASVHALNVIILKEMVNPGLIRTNALNNSSMSETFMLFDLAATRKNPVVQQDIQNNLSTAQQSDEEALREKLKHRISNLPMNIIHGAKSGR